MKSSFVILLLSFHFVFDCTVGGKSSILEAVRNGQAEARKRKDQVINSPIFKKGPGLQIAGKGYQYWNDHTMVNFYGGVSRSSDKLIPFVNKHLFNTLPLDNDERKALNELYETLDFSQGFDLIGEDFVFQRDITRNSGSFFLVYAEESCSNPQEVDLISFKIEAKFNLAPNIFVLEEGKGNIFGGSYGDKVVKLPASLTKDALAKIRNYFEITSFIEIEKTLMILESFGIK